MQTFTFYASEDKLENRGNYVAEKISVSKTVLLEIQNKSMNYKRFGREIIKFVLAVLAIFKDQKIR